MCSRSIQMCGMAFLVILVWHIGFAGQKIRYKFEKGKEYKYSTNVESKTSGQAMGQEFTVNTSGEIAYLVTLVNLDADVMTLTAKIETFTLKLNMPMMGFNDSTIVMNDYLGKRIKVIMTTRGKTLSTAPIDTITPSRIQMMANINPADLFKQVLLELPENEMDMNNSWKRTAPDTISRSGLKIITKPNIDYKVVAAEKKNNLNCWKIAISGSSTLEGSGNQRGTDIAVDGSIKISGTAFIAPAEGVLVLSEQSTENEMTTTATGSQTGASTMSINTKVKTVLSN